MSDLPLPPLPAWLLRRCDLKLEEAVQAYAREAVRAAVERERATWVTGEFDTAEDLIKCLECPNRLEAQAKAEPPTSQGLGSQLQAEPVALPDQIQAALDEHGVKLYAHPPTSELPQCVLDLIAVLNRDGGHYRAEHGLEAACKRAMDRYYELTQTPTSE